jgi:hypothetical protein
MKIVGHFDQPGLSKCPSTFPYINGLFTNKTTHAKHDKIYHLEGASSCEGVENIKSECVEVDWLTSFDR